MHLLPTDLVRQFDALLDLQKLYGRDKAAYLKWLRFYWDFCSKYHHDPYRSESLPPFLTQLREKRQSDQQRNQARQAVTWFYRLQPSLPPTSNVAAPSENLTAVSRNLVAPPKSAVLPLNAIAENAASSAVRSSIQEQSNIKEPRHHDDQLDSGLIVQTGSSWVSVFDTLNSEIKIRHYSPKTLKAYRGWARHFQTFTQSKDYRALTQQDVVDFLSYLGRRKTGFRVQPKSGVQCFAIFVSTRAEKGVRGN